MMFTKDPVAVDDAEAPLAGAETFDERRKLKWARGRAERGLPHDAPFEGDPAAEGQEECLDKANYIEQLLRDGDIGQEEAEYFVKREVESCLWLESVMARRASSRRSA